MVAPEHSAPLPAAADADRKRRALARVAFFIVIGLYAVAIALRVLSGGFAWEESTLGAGAVVVELLVAASTFAFPAVGALITLRRPRNPIGWLCLGIGFGFALTGVAETYPEFALVADRGLPGIGHALAYASVGWILPVGLLLFLVLLFPDGRLPSRRWRVLAALIVSTLLVSAVASLFGVEDFSDSGHPEIANPLHIEAVGPLLEVLGIAPLVLPVWIVAAAASLAVRYRGAAGVTRLQLKWLVAAGAAVALLFVATMATSWLTERPGDEPSLVAELMQNASLLSFALIPIAIGVAMLRHRLYDIDVIVNRTLVYGGVTVVLALAFGVANIASQRVLEAVSGQRSDLLTGALAVGAAVAFGPMRRRLRPLVDRVLPARAELALLFTDIVESTQILATVGDERWRGLLNRYRAAVRAELARAGGHEVDTAGDSFFVTFDRPAASLRCAWATRDAVRAFGLETRTGVHFGECEMRGETVSGLAVHTAARVMAAAGPGEILVSSALLEAIGGSEVELVDRGIHELKGVPGEWRLFQVESLVAT